jgi:hypothetical protein
MSESLAERVVRLETEVPQLRAMVTEHQNLTKEMDKKLDELLTLRSKGVGVFWLASGLVGTGIFGFFTWIVEWFKHG